MSDEQELILPRPRQFLTKQKEVFDLVFDDSNDKTRYVLYSGAVRAGKTLLLAHVGVKAALDYPGSVGMVLSNIYPQLKDAVFKTFVEEIAEYQKILDENNIPIELMRYTTSPGKMDLFFYNGSSIMFRSCDKEEKIRGVTLDWFELDEPIQMKEDIFKQLMARISGKKMPFHFGLLATNPGAENHWIYKNFYTKKADRFFTVETNVYENVLLPSYTEYIKDLESNYDPDWTRRFLHGYWGAFSGQIYKSFSVDKHVRDFDPELKNVPGIDRFFAGVDWGIRDPCCILVLMKTRANNLFVIEEYYENERSSFETAHTIAKLHKKYNFTKVYCDPSAADLVKQAFDLGVPIGRFDNGEVKSYANNQVSPGIAKLQSTFKNNKITIHSSCINLIRSLQSYRYKGDGETPLKEDDHAADSLRYSLTDYTPILDETEFGCGKFMDRLGRLRRST